MPAQNPGQAHALKAGRIAEQHRPAVTASRLGNFLLISPETIPEPMQHANLVPHVLMTDQAAAGQQALSVMLNVRVGV